MSEYTLNADTLRLLALFEAHTGARVRDVVEEEDRLTFLVDAGYVGKAIGKGASNLKQLRDLLKKEVDVIGYDPDRMKFLGNLFHRFKVHGITVDTRRDGSEVAKVAIDAADKGKAIGKGGRNINLAKTLLDRHFSIKDISIVEEADLKGDGRKPAGAPREGAPGERRGGREGGRRRGGRGGRGRGGAGKGAPQAPGAPQEGPPQEGAPAPEGGAAPDASPEGGAGEPEAAPEAPTRDAAPEPQAESPSSAPAPEAPREAAPDAEPKTE